MTFARHLTHFTVVAAIAAAGISTAGPAHAGEPNDSLARTGNPTVRIIELPRVTVITKRTAPVAQQFATAAGDARPVIQLPRVLVVAKRLAPLTTLVAERPLRAPGA